MLAPPPAVLNTTSLADAATTLAKRDKHLAQILLTHGYPPLWRRPATFATLVRIILEQQVSLLSADAMYRRLQRAICPFSPDGFLKAGEHRLRELGVTRQKTAYLLHLSTEIATGRLNLRRLARLSDADVKQKLTGIRGIGSWSADVYLLMAMRRADVWPSGDLALAVAMKELKDLPQRPTFEELEELAEPWRPHRAVAARMLWQFYLAKKANGSLLRDR